MRVSWRLGEDAFENPTRPPGGLRSPHPRARCRSAAGMVLCVKVLLAGALGRQQGIATVDGAAFQLS